MIRRRIAPQRVTRVEAPVIDRALTVLVEQLEKVK